LPAVSLEVGPVGRQVHYPGRPWVRSTSLSLAKPDLLTRGRDASFPIGPDMARNRKERTTKKPAAQAKDRRRRGRPKFCVFCAEGAIWVDYKDIGLLRRFVNDRGRIRPRGATGTCAQHQRDVASAIKTARELALLPYAVRVLANDKAGRRGGGRDARPRADAAEGARGEPAADEVPVGDTDELVTSGADAAV